MTDPKPLAPSVRAMLAKRRRCTRCMGAGWYKTWTPRLGQHVVAPCPVCFGSGTDPGNAPPPNR